MKNVIIALTNNPKKMDEYRNVFSLYGMDVHQHEVVSTLQDIQKIITNSPIPVAFVFREKSNIYDKETGRISEQKDLSVVVNKTHMTVYRPENGEVRQRNYYQEIEGYIDISRRENEQDVFDWDDIFVNRHIDKSYHELKKEGLKVSSRDLVLSDVIKDYIFYPTRIDLNFQPQKQQQSIDFTNLVSDFVKKNEYLTNPYMDVYQLDGLLSKVVGIGLFFKSAKNRREKNYWLPGLNAGVPLVPKKDPIHEITFMFHDFTHFIMPDLMYDGKDEALNKQVYVLYRMMSEAISLCMADMLFVDTLVKSGYEYDYGKRKIYPLFSQLTLDFEHDFQGSMKKLLYANVQYALLGEDVYFKELLKDEECKELKEYKEKYQRFFVEDYKWTVKNYENMQKQKKVNAKWMELVNPIVNALDIPFVTTQEFIEKANVCNKTTKTLVDSMFEYVYAEMLIPYFTQDKAEIKNEEETAFLRYLLGQMGIFAKYNFLQESRTYYLYMMSYLFEHKGTLDKEKIQRLRSFYNQYLDLLKEKKLISDDDVETYKDMYMVFTPFYVFYDRKKGDSLTLKEISSLYLN